MRSRLLESRRAQIPNTRALMRPSPKSCKISSIMQIYARDLQDLLVILQRLPQDATLAPKPRTLNPKPRTLRTLGSQTLRLAPLSSLSNRFGHICSTLHGLDGPISKFPSPTPDLSSTFDSKACSASAAKPASTHQPSEPAPPD